ncbi:MAG: type VII secretion-associated protein, partial [Pseudonocardiales bacterium]|nr:type VII secretion-associated protein [Pseudonocardiales bacterium]
LAGLIGPDVEEVVLVYPPARPSALVRTWLEAAEAVAPRVYRVSAPVAAAAGTGAQAVLDVGRAGSEATLLHADRIVARRSSGIGGDRLDLAVRAALEGASADDARRVRETLSLLPEARHGPVRVDAAQVHALLTPLFDEAIAALAEVVAVAREPIAVLLTGGVARCPLLAERVDVAAFASEVLVATRPDLAAVLGALRLPLPPHRFVTGSTRARPTRVSGSDTPSPQSRSVRVEEAPEPAANGSSADIPVAQLLPAPRPSRRARRWGSTAATALLIGGFAGAGTTVVLPLHSPPAAAAPAVGGGVLVQYGYRLDLPSGWAHTGGLPERRRSLLTPTAAPEGTDLIAVERTPLGYDAESEPERAAAELRTQFDRAVAAGSTLSSYGSERIGGRVATTYLQQERADVVVEWFVVFDGDAQLSVGCQHTPAGIEAVRAACAVVVGSIRLT